MDTNIWQYWPWFSLFIFAILVRLLGGVGRSITYDIRTLAETQRGSDSTGVLLLISLIVGASVCILILYTQNQ